MSVNKAILVGNVGNNPEIRTTQDGRKIATFSLATSDKWRNKKTGEMQEKVEWHRIVILTDGLVSIVEQYVSKGTKLFIEGAMQTRKWTDKAGVDKYTTEIILQGFNNKLEILDSRNGSGGRRDDKGNQSESYGNSDDSFNDENVDDDVPF